MRRKVKPSFGIAVAVALALLVLSGCGENDKSQNQNETSDNIEEALMRATKFSDKPLVIMGSFYLAGEVLLLLEG